MSIRYAANTKVSANRTRAEIFELLERAGAAGKAYIEEGHLAVIQFKIGGRLYVLPLQTLSPDAEQFRKRWRADWHRWINYDQKKREQLYQQHVRQRWRALFLLIKATCVTVEEGLVSTEQAFAPWLALPDGRPARDHVVEKAEQIQAEGSVRLLPLAVTP